MVWFALYLMRSFTLWRGHKNGKRVAEAQEKEEKYATLTSCASGDVWGMVFWSVINLTSVFAIAYVLLLLRYILTWRWRVAISARRYRLRAEECYGEFVSVDLATPDHGHKTVFGLLHSGDTLAFEDSTQNSTGEFFAVCH